MFKKKKAGKKEALEIDITSLLDILVILLVFLLKSYNASDLTVDLVDNITLPTSSASDLGHSAIVVQVDKNGAVFVDNKQLDNVSFKSEKIESLYSKLVELEKDEQKKEERSIASQSPRPINIVLDQKQTYEIMQKVMHTVALAGHDQIKLIVQGIGND